MTSTKKEAKKMQSCLQKAGEIFSARLYNQISCGRKGVKQGQSILALGLGQASSVGLIRRSRGEKKSIIVPEKIINYNYIIIIIRNYYAIINYEI